MAGPWSAGEGHFFAELSYRRLRATTYAFPDGYRTPIPEFSRDDGALYVAYGLSHRLTLSAELPYRSSDLADAPDELQRLGGLADVRLGAQVQLARRGPWSFAALGSVQLPTGDETRGRGLQPTGSGAWEATTSLSAGRSLARGRAYASLDAGYQYRGQGLRDGLVYEFELGWNATPRLVVAGHVRGVEPFSREAGSRTPGSLVGVGDRVTYVAFGPAVVVRLTKAIGLEAGVEAAARARNLADGTAYRVGLFWRR